MHRKNYLLTLFFVCSAFFVQGQNKKHFEFMRIPINGSLESFSYNLLKKGFKTVNPDSKVLFKGIFAGEEADLSVFTTPISNTVYSVLIYFGDFSTWNSLESTFKNVVDQYSIKYGEPDWSIKKFIYPFAEGDGNELAALSTEKLEYTTKWELENGIIVATISKIDKIAILIYYFDNENGKLLYQEKSIIIQRDI